MIELAGEPDAKMGTSIWMFSGSILLDASGGEAAYDTLLVGFHQDVVVKMKLISKESARGLLLSGDWVVTYSARGLRMLRETSSNAVKK